MIGNRSTAGFTLIELLAVLAILALAATWAAPLIGRAPPQLAIKTTALDIAASLADARTAARRTSREQAFTLDLAGRRFWSDAAPAPRGLGPGIGVELVTIASEQGGTGGGRIRFYPDGSATGGRIVLSDGARRATVTVDWLTGAATIDRSGW
jgi:general secretion pathway protein H